MSESGRGTETARSDEMILSSTTTESIPVEKRSGYRVLWAWALGICFLVSVFAGLRGGYVGPDCDTHLARVLDPTRLFDFSAMDPPLFCLISRGFFRMIGRNSAFPITLSIVQAAINIVALWWFFLYTERRFRSPVLHLALVFFLTFLPVRMIHALSVGTDWMVIPVFVLVLFLFDKFLSEKTSSPMNATLLGLALAVGIWSKYSFIALLPALFVIFAVLWWKRRWTLTRFVVICLLSFLLPSALFLYSAWKSTRAKGIATERIWLQKGMVPDMNYKDLFSVKVADLQLFKAPEMFKREPSDGNNYHMGYRVAHQHSYLALSHMSTFTDTQNLFQDMPLSSELDPRLNADYKTRRPWNTPWNVASMSLGTLWTVLALIGTPFIFLGAVRNLFRDKLEREDVMALLGTAYFLLMFLPIPFVIWGCRDGFWTPRLILPCLFFFYWAAFLFLDRTIVRKSGKIAFDILILVIIQCGIEIVMLA
jgi:4-amino-4-deoxy-L-arabinose transferase-like glycosyltransferase